MEAFDDPSNVGNNEINPSSSLDLLDNSFNDTDSNWSTVANFTRLFAAAAVEAAPKIANYTLNMLDVGLSLATEASDVVTNPTLSIPTTTRATETAFAIMTNSQLNISTLGHINSLHDSSPVAEQVPEHIMDHAPQLSRSGLLKVYVLAVMALFSLLGNFLTIWNIYKTRISRRNSRHTWSAIYSLMFHLSIADVLVTGFCLIGEAAWCYTVQWLANELTCKLVKLFQMFSLYLSTYVLVLIGVDRWIAVKYPMKSGITANSLADCLLPRLMINQMLIYILIALIRHPRNYKLLLEHAGTTKKFTHIFETHKYDSVYCRRLSGQSDNPSIHQ